MARRKSSAHGRLTKRQMALAEKDHNKRKDSNCHPMKQNTRRLTQLSPQILPRASSDAVSHPADPFARTCDVITPPSIQKMTLAEKDRNKGNDSKGHPTEKHTMHAVQMTSQFAPCASSHAMSRPTHPFARTSDVRDPPSVQAVPSSHTSQPTNSDAGRNPRSSVALEIQNNDGKPIIYLSGQGFLPSRPAANEIENILKSHYTDPWPSWKMIPISTRDLCFGEFLGKFSICPSDYDWAKKNFEKQGATMMKSVLNEAQTTMNKPNWIKDDVWERLCEHWKSEELKKDRAKIMDYSWVDIQDEFTRTLEQLTKNAFEQGNPPPSELGVWYDVVRSKKGEMSGLGMAGRYCYHGSSSSMEWVKKQDYDELRIKMKEIRNDTDKLKTRVANIEGLAEHNNALIRELIESMNMPSTMVESQDEDDRESLSGP